MIFALLYGLGLRVGEVSRLCRKDIDLDAQLLIIRQTKFEKDRLVPFGPKMARAIAGFLDGEESRLGRSRPTARHSPSTSASERRLAPTRSAGHSTNCCPHFS
jgi:integrase